LDRIDRAIVNADFYANRAFLHDTQYIALAP